MMKNGSGVAGIMSHLSLLNWRNTMVDSRLTRYIDDEGRPWVLCQGCCEECSPDQLAVDPEDGQLIDMCKTCFEK